MAEMFKVRIGSDEPRYLPAQDGQKQVLYVDVVENTRVFDRDTNSWGDGDARWYEASFRGRDADLIMEQYQKGDSLIVVGETEKRVTEKADGRVFKSTRLYVDSFGPDPRLSAIVIDRTRKQEQTAQAGPRFEAVQEAHQAPTQAVAPQLASPPAPPAPTAPAQAAAPQAFAPPAQMYPQQDPWAQSAQPAPQQAAQSQSPGM